MSDAARRLLTCRPLLPRRRRDVLPVAAIRMCRWWLVVCAVGITIKAHTVTDALVHFGTK